MSDLRTSRCHLTPHVAQLARQRAADNLVAVGLVGGHAAELRCALDLSVRFERAFPGLTRRTVGEPTGNTFNLAASRGHVGQRDVRKGFVPGVRHHDLQRRGPILRGESDFTFLVIRAYRQKGASDCFGPISPVFGGL